MKKRMLLAMMLVILLLGLSACGNSANGRDQVDSKVDESTQSSEDIANDDITDDETNETVSEDGDKVVGNKTEFLEKLDNIQKQLDALPEKEEADMGITSGMNIFYGMSYEMYDDALNEIYALLQEELSPEVMEDLKAKQIRWIEQKENLALEASAEFSGGTLENVTYVSTLYNLTKERCYELVNQYMVD